MSLDLKKKNEVTHLFQLLECPGLEFLKTTDGKLVQEYVNQPIICGDPKFRISWQGCRAAHGAQGSIPGRAGHPELHSKVGEALMNPPAGVTEASFQGWRR